MLPLPVHLCWLQPIEVTETDLRVAHSDQIRASFTHHRPDERPAILRMQITGCSLFSVNGRYMPVYVPFAEGVVYQNPHGWYVMSSYVSKLESFGIQLESERRDCGSVGTATPSPALSTCC